MQAASIWSGARIHGAAADADTLVVEAGRIAWTGPAAAVPRQWADAPRQTLAGGWLLPAWVDCHSHLVWAGSRLAEVALRRQGASYADITRAGGGIRSTIAATRAADEDALFAAALTRAQALVAEGVTTLEIKSGYGAELATERRQLAVARRIGTELGIDVRCSYLALHALPPEFEGRADAYVSTVCEHWLPALAAEGLVDAVDAYCEALAFSPAQVERLFLAAQRLGLPVKLHAEQLSDQGGAQLAARYQALSCDHLEWLSDAGIAAMARAASVAVLLPGAFYFLKEIRLPPIAGLRAAGVPMAVATDMNPGTSPIVSLLAAAHLAGTLFGLTPEELLAAISVNAARALGLSDRGRLAPGQLASFSHWTLPDPAELFYLFGLHRPRQVVHRGRTLVG